MKSIQGPKIALKNFINNKVPIRNVRGLVSTTPQSDQGKNWDSDGPNKGNSNLKNATCLGIAALSSFIAFKRYYVEVEARFRDEIRNETSEGTPSDKKNLKIFTKKEVSEHNDLSKGIWITYRGNVYDITDFIRHHPGGSHTIMMGAGGDVGPFWDTYTFHQEHEVQRLLAGFQIGILDEKDAKEIIETNASGPSEGPYSNDPKRSPLLKMHTKEPCNAETPSRLLPSSYITPTDIFFVRNHLPVPEVDLDSYKLSICLGSDGDPDNESLVAELSFDDLKTRFKPYTIHSVIQCSGNRRDDLKKIKEIKGLGWNVGAMGNASWTGVKLVDLLSSLNLKQTEAIKHVQMEGLDCDMTGQSYGASISADVAFDPNRDVLIAYEMNGKPLTRDHGFPLRLVAPGVTGARNVKWLGKIILSHEESHSHWQRNDYKSFSPNVDMFNIDYSQSISIQEMPVQSAICDPVDGDEIVIEKGMKTIPVRGYAYSGGGKMIVRVDVTIDGGRSWMTANLLDQPKLDDGRPDYTNRNRVWSWTRWSLELPVSEDGHQIEIMCRAFDASYNGQPERPETIWNVRGVVNNSWHRLKINLRRS